MKPKHPYGCIHLLRWIVASCIIVIITVWISVGIPLSALSRTVADRAHIKYWLLVSGVYNNPIALISDVIMHSNATDSPLIPIAEQAKNKDSAIAQAMSTVLYPTLVQHSMQTVINATYDWLEGKTDRPDFTIALLPNDAAVSTISTYLPESALNQVKQQTTLSSEQLPITPQTSRNAQRAFQWLVVLPGIVVAVGLIGVSIALIMIPNRRRSFMVVGTWLLSVGSILAISEVVLANNFQLLFQFYSKTLVPAQLNWLQPYMVGPVQLAYHDLLNRMARYSLAVASVGGILLLLVFITQWLTPVFQLRRRQQPRPHYSPAKSRPL